jgi:hypothetical protein
MTQTLRPVATTIGNFTVTGAASGHLAVDEVVLDTADYVESPTAPVSEVVRFVLEDTVDPESLATHGVHVVAAKNLSGGGQINMLVELVGKSTASDVVHASATFPDITTTATDYVLTLTTAQIAAIPVGDYEGDTSGQSDLDVRITFNQV